jgi:LPS-assembly protein
VLPTRRRSPAAIVCLCVGASCAAGAAAQDLCLPELAEPPAELPDPVLSTDDEPLDITFGRIDLSGDAAAELSGRVEFSYRGATIAAERATVGNQSIDVGGAVTLTNSDVTVYTEDLHVDRETETIVVAGAGFEMPKRPARGSADELLIRSDSTMSVLGVLFTTCPADNVAWELKARSVDFDVNAGIGAARGVKLQFKGVPILYAPYFSFPINDERKSGFLTPDISDRDRTGFDLRVPYYLNLAPNYDLLLEPRYMSERGTQLRSEFRYLLPRSEGQFDFEYLPDDDEIDRTRRYLNLSHETLFGDGWRVLSGIQEVSDDAYFDDLGNSLAVTSQTHLNRFLDVDYFAPHWSMLARLQNYQTIDPVLTPEQRPYERVPQMAFFGRWRGARVQFQSDAELVNFDRDVGTTGWRFDSTQEVSMRFARAGMYLTPAVAWRQTNYRLDEPNLAGDDSLARSLPVGSLDMGLTFERGAGASGDWIQTLEPRLLYVQVPYEDQADLPVFDTVLPDFNLIQLFRKYQFVGPDRVTDTDQVSFGVTTRLIDARGGRERLTATLGQTRYLNAQRVSLPGTAPNAANASDYVAEMSIGLRDAWNLDVGYQWNDAADSTSRVETRFEYRPQDDRLFGFGYRYRQDLLEQGDFSLVWPVAERWRLIGRYSYSLLEKEPLEQFVGWEYDACCWRFRMVGRRYVSRRTGETDSAISIQLELKGLSQRASSPEELLDRGILGYRSISRPN